MKVVVVVMDVVVVVVVGGPRRVHAARLFKTVDVLDAECSPVSTGSKCWLTSSVWCGGEAAPAELQLPRQAC
jgi:hypothetical protein